MLFLNVFLTLILSISTARVDASVWDYNIRNPNLWPYLEGETFQQCGSSLQSPINIKKEIVRCDDYVGLVKPLNLTGYDKDMEFNFTNSQLTLLGTLQDAEATYSFSGSGFPRQLVPFELAQFHFHWGQHNFEGSEHTIEYKYSPLELHLVHVSTKDPKYFAVIGVLFELSATRNPDLESIIRAADYLATHFNSSYLETVNLAKLLPTNLNRFYFYEGSLTVPPCTERVYWTVMADKIPISEDQLKHIHENPSKVNFRPPQPLNDRLVTTIACELAGGSLNSAHSLESNFLLMFLFLKIYI